jgi:glutamate N-acetyltransferase/amino-acid N-acetyltransferase
MKFFLDCDGVTEAQGFFASGVASNIMGKNNGKLDLGIIYSKRPCTSAGTFTTNDVKASPVRYCMELLDIPNQVFHGVVANSGNANACTGKQGDLDCAKMASETARHLKVDSREVLVCSTGRIGVQLPMSRITAGIANACQDTLDELDGGKAFQEAILTSDTRTKSCSAQIETPSGKVTIGGTVKGAGMIQPNMATMLAFLTTDADVSSNFLKKCLGTAVDQSFNRMTIDGDMSTNDSVLILANGFSRVKIEDESGDIQAEFKEAVLQVCKALARKCVTDGEKVTKFVELRIDGAPSNEDAEKVARCIANSLLVKSSWYGSDPNWGRIVDAAGYAQIGLDFDRFDLSYNEVPAVEMGKPLTMNKAKWKEIVSQKAFEIKIHLHMGEGSAIIWSNDLSEEYVNYNKSE